MESKKNYLNLFTHNRARLIILLGVTLWLSFFYKLGDVPLFDRDEGAFSEATREMFERGDYVSTYLNAEPRYDKPILIYWFQALSVMVFGMNEFGFRFPSALFASLWVLVVYFFSKRELGHEKGLQTGLIMATSLWILVIGRAAIADALLNLLVTLSMFSFYYYFRLNEKKYLYWTFFWTALGFLTKGPVAVLIPGAVSLFFYLSFRRWKDWLRAVFHPRGILIFLLTAAPWYVVQYMKEGPPFIEGFFFKHNVNRYVSTMEGHGGAFIYYLPILILILLPYSALIIKTLFRVRDIFRDDLDRYMWFWFLFVLIFFSLSGTKLPHYILHGVPPLFLLMARYSGTLKSRLWALLPSILFGLLILFLPDAIRQIWDMVKDVYFKALIDDAWDVFDLGYRMWSIVILTCLVLLLFFKKIRTDNLLLLSGYMLTILVLNVIWPKLGEIQQRPIKNAAEFTVRNDLELVMWGMDNPSFSVYRKKVTPWRRPEEGEIAITKINKLKKLEEYEVLFKQGGVVIVKVQKTAD